MKTLTCALMTLLLCGGEVLAMGLPPVSAPAGVNDYARLPVCTLSADGKKLAVEPCRTAPAKNPMPRRPVPQIIQRMPAQARPTTVPLARVPPPPTRQTPSGTLIPANNCAGGSCVDAGGVRHIETGNNVNVTPGGKTCVRNGVFLQCS